MRVQAGRRSWRTSGVLPRAPPAQGEKKVSYKRPHSTPRWLVAIILAGYFAPRTRVRGTSTRLKRDSRGIPSARAKNVAGPIGLRHAAASVPSAQDRVVERDLTTVKKGVCRVDREEGNLMLRNDETLMVV
jgi:hypothetical protein